MYPEPEYYLGWMIQPIFSDYFYVYPRDDSSQQSRGYYVKGCLRDAMEFVEHKVKL
jgi:hypothetical protein